MTNLAPLMSSARPDWQTPDCVLERVRRVAPIGLDPCTTAENPTDAERFYTPKEDGLLSTWAVPPNSLIYCNPPYGRGIQQWMERCRSAVGQVIALIPARTDTRWFPWDASLICFWRGRLTFRGAPAPAPFPSAVVYWADRRTTGWKLFRDAFESAGNIVLP